MRNLVLRSLCYKRRLLVKMCCYTFICILFVIYYVGHSRDTEIHFSFRSIPTPPLKPKLILFANKWFFNTPFPYTNETKSKCPECIFTHDPTQFQISDAVVFNYWKAFKRPLVQRPQPHQIWVMVITESAGLVRHPGSKWIKNYDGMFNWMMTYRLDSDVPMPYGRFVQFSESPLPKYDDRWAFVAGENSVKSTAYNPNFTKIPTMEQLKGKKMAAWIVTKCATRSRREALVNELSKFIPIDRYGKCGNFRCPSKRRLESSIDCKLQISDSYKFYLAFENSLCEDYVTEKYFDTLLTQMIPVVYSAVKDDSHEGLNG